MNVILFVLLLFTSISLSSVLGQTDTCDCGDEDAMTVTKLDDWKEFQFPTTGGQDYPNNCDCNWRAASEYKISVEFEFFQTQKDHDFVYIYDLVKQNGEDNTPGSESRKCSGTYCNSYTSEGPGLRLRFTSDANITERGFKVKVIYEHGGSWFQWFHIAIVIFGLILVSSVVFSLFIMFRKRQAWKQYVQRQRAANPPRRPAAKRPVAVVPSRTPSIHSHRRSNAIYSVPIPSPSLTVESNPSPPPAYFPSIPQRPRGSSIHSTGSYKITAMPTIVEHQEMKYGSY